MLMTSETYLTGVCLPAQLNSVGLFNRGGKKMRLALIKMMLLNYFVLLNLASVHDFIELLLGQKTVIWTPRKG